MDRSGRRAALPASVVALGLVSLFTDISSEMIFSLLPAFLSAQMPGSAPVLLGAMEGLADLVSAALKWWAGKWSDRAPKLRPMVLGGYAASTLARPFMAFVMVWWQPLVVRVLDRVGKGLRSAPRDAMIAHWVAPEIRGRAFGFHRAMDHTGAAIGAALAFALVGLGVAVDRVFLLSAIPGVLGVATVFFAREPARPPPPATQEALAPVPRRLFWYLGPVAVFGLGNATDAFLLLKLSEQGARPALLPLAWLALHVVKAAVSTPAGRVADRIGKSRVVLGGWTLYAVSYFALAVSPSVAATFVIIAFYGLYHAFAEGAEKALLTDLTPAAARGRAFGLYHSMTGVGSLLAGLLFGALWKWAGSPVAFVCAGALAGVSAVLLAVLLPRAREAGRSDGR
ncbi:MAG: MFS transporter [Myxococcaceae bacterium]